MGLIVGLILCWKAWYSQYFRYFLAFPLKNPIILLTDVVYFYIAESMEEICAAVEGLLTPSAR